MNRKQRKQRDILILREIRETHRTYEDIAEEFEISRARVNQIALKDGIKRRVDKK